MKVLNREGREKILIFRTVKGLSQREMGEMLGVKQQVVGMWERLGVIPEKRYQQISELYGFDVEQYLEEVNISSTVYADHHSAAAGRDATVNGISLSLSPEEQVLINLLREKDDNKTHLRKYIIELMSV